MYRILEGVNLDIKQTSPSIPDLKLIRFNSKFAYC
jgi:hypothetical protein